MSIKTITFAKNALGVDSMQVDTAKQTIWQSCAVFPTLAGRHYRLTRSDQRMEFRQADKYIEIQADIKSIV